MASWSKNISEAPLQYQRGMLNSILYRLDEFDRYAETEEIITGIWQILKGSQALKPAPRSGCSITASSFLPSGTGKAKRILSIRFIFLAWIYPCEYGRPVHRGYDIDVDIIMLNAYGFRWICL